MLRQLQEVGTLVIVLIQRLHIVRQELRILRILLVQQLLELRVRLEQKLMSGIQRIRLILQDQLQDLRLRLGQHSGVKITE